MVRRLPFRCTLEVDSPTDEAVVMLVSGKFDAALAQSNGSGWP